jgi:nucleoside-diphosphate-sugar epimerase
MSKGLNILITGGAGYIGSILSPALLAQGHKVTVVDNFMFGQMSLAALCADPNFDVVRGDTREEAVLKPLVANADVVIPLAALVGAPLCDRDRTGAVSINRTSVETLMGLLSKDQRVLYATTNSGYGIGEKGAFCTEESPLRPISLYGRTKVEAEDAVRAFGNSISFRLATVFGFSPRMRLDLLVNDFVYRAINDRVVVLFEAHFKRNYIHIRDVARAFIHGIENFDAMKGNVFNVGLSDANLSKAELCARIQTHIAGFQFFEAPVGEDPDKRDYIVSNAKIEATGFKPAYSLDDGIVELRKGYRMLKNNAYGNV